MSRGEYTPRMAARDTRRAIQKVRKAIADLKACSTHWEDLDEMFRGDIYHLEDVPKEIANIERDLDEAYPQRPKRRKAGVA